MPDIDICTEATAVEKPDSPLQELDLVKKQVLDQRERQQCTGNIRELGQRASGRPPGAGGWILKGGQELAGETGREGSSREGTSQAKA